MGLGEVGRGKHHGGDDGGRSQEGDDRERIQVTKSTARTKAHGGTNGGRSQGEIRGPTTNGVARRVGEPDGAKET